MSRTWWYRVGGEVRGPTTAQDLYDSVKVGRLSEATEASHDQVLWAAVASHPDLRAELALASAPTSALQPLLPAEDRPTDLHAPTASRGGSVLGAVATTALAGAFWLLISLIQFAVFLADASKTDIALRGMWNMTLVGLYAWIAWGLWHGSPKALSWARGTHFLNAVLCGYQAFTDAPLLAVAVPLHLLGWVFALNIGPTQKEPSVARPTGSPMVAILVAGGAVLLALVLVAVGAATKASESQPPGQVTSMTPASAPAASEQPPPVPAPGATARRDAAARIAEQFRTLGIGLRVDTQGLNDTVLRLRGDGCNRAALDAARTSERQLMSLGFVRSICGDDAGNVRAERVMTGIDPSQSETAPATPARPDPAIPFGRYVSSHMRGATATAMGVYLNIHARRCRRRDLDEVGRMEDDPETLAAALRTEIQFITCNPEEDGPVTRRWPSPGVTIPAGIDWERRYVVTPSEERHAPPTVWCTGGESGGFENAICSRSADECAREQRRVTDNGAELGWRMRQCAITSRLWCFDTAGTEIQCALTQEGCEAIKDRLQGRGSDCESRWAL